jgi:hypothetical protein
MCCHPVSFEGIVHFQLLPVMGIKNINFQPSLQNNLVVTLPLKETDFESLYTAASAPLIPEQHPDKNRYQQEAIAG